MCGKMEHSRGVLGRPHGTLGGVGNAGVQVLDAARRVRLAILGGACVGDGLADLALDLVDPLAGFVAFAIRVSHLPLEAGEVILSGSLAPLVPVVPGDCMNMKIGGIGTASVRFV